MKRLLPILVFLVTWMLALPSWGQVPTQNATVTFQDPNTGQQAVDGVRIEFTKDGAPMGQPIILQPGTLTYVTIVTNEYPGSHQICANGTPFNSAGNGPMSQDCKTTVPVIKVAPNALIQFQLQLQ